MPYQVKLLPHLSMLHPKVSGPGCTLIEHPNFLIHKAVAKLLLENLLYIVIFVVTKRIRFQAKLIEIRL